MYNMLVINPGSTSTKISYFRDEKKFSRKILYIRGKS
jgi:butyrate kinase